MEAYAIEEMAVPGESSPSRCKVRLLRQVASTSYIFAECSVGYGGFVGPHKVEGDVVTAPDDGSFYGPSIRRIFPADIAEALTSENEQRFRP